MKVFVAPERNESGKFKGIIKAFPGIWEGSILDVGCRSGNFKKCLPMDVKSKLYYVGVDLNDPADIISNLEKGLPFKNSSYDVVLALDVLEHTDDIYTAVNELCRVSRKHIVISLPNSYDLKSRISFLFGRSICGKYGLPINPPPDRHRWLFSLKEASMSIGKIAFNNKYIIHSDGCLIGPKRSWLGANNIISYLPNLFSPTYLVLLRRVDSNTNV